MEGRIPGWPGFLRQDSIIYKVEMLLVTVLLFSIFYWRLFVVKDIRIYSLIFWIIWPDLAAFIPIGIATRSSKPWPDWGPGLYNFFHTLIVAIPVVSVWSLIVGSTQWAMMGWLAHITFDRSLGFYLRAKVGNGRSGG